jgi:hypothetical protein
MKKKPQTLEDVKAAARKAIAQPKRRDPAAPESPVEEAEALIDTLAEFLPIWRISPSVFRVASVSANGVTGAYSENLTLPAAKHDLRLLVEMLNYIRDAKGLDKVKMPLLLQPDEIAYALEHPAPCHCDEERELAARARSIRRLGKRASRRWLYTGQDVLDRDERACVECGAKKDLHPHWTGGDFKWTDKDGYVTLCRRCHVLQNGAGTPPEVARLRAHLEPGDVTGEAIRSQLTLVFQKGSLRWLALAAGREYVVINA